MAYVVGMAVSDPRQPAVTPNTVTHYKLHRAMRLQNDGEAHAVATRRAKMPTLTSFDVAVCSATAIIRELCRSHIQQGTYYEERAHMMSENDTLLLLSTQHRPYTVGTEIV